MAPAEVLAYLEKLPSIEWPYGLVVGMQESGVRAPVTTPKFRKTAKNCSACSQKQE
jgi:hypothetical protein